ncbi:unnamed protein product, partial [Prunus brigantina]
MKPFLFPLLGGFAFMLLLVHAQDDQTGFISIDCGLAENTSYAEKMTGINYISDETFISTGENNVVLQEYRNKYQEPYMSLRSFPAGIRNCYKINVTNGTKTEEVDDSPDSLHDVHDRFWYGYYKDNWKQVITSSTIYSDVHDSFQPPSVVMSTAATPKNGTDALYISWMDFD